MAMQGVLKCPKCKVSLGELGNVGQVLMLCPRCLKEVTTYAYPALFRSLPESATSTGEAAVEGDSSCFFHPSKKAVVPCDACGRFLCALCEVNLDGQHLCPTCLETGARKKNIQSLERSRHLNGRVALTVSILPFLITGPIAIFLAIKHWNGELSLVSPARWHTRVALVMGIIQTCLLVLFLISVFA